MGLVDPCSSDVVLRGSSHCPGTRGCWAHVHRTHENVVWSRPVEGLGVLQALVPSTPKIVPAPFRFLLGLVVPVLHSTNFVVRLDVDLLMELVLHLNGLLLLVLPHSDYSYSVVGAL